MTGAVRDLVARHPFAADMTAGEVDALCVGGRVVDLEAWELLFHEGRPADHCYLVLSGHIGLGLHVPHRGAVVVDTAGPGDLLGWSWLLPPHVWRFDATARTAARVVALDAARVRATCSTDPALDRLVAHAVLRTMAHRLESTRHQLLDVYRHGDG